jgi:membrane-bound lytic murein transglycosylase
MNKSETSGQATKAGDDKSGMKPSDSKSPSTMNKSPSDPKADSSKAATDSKKMDTNKSATDSTKSDTSKSATDSNANKMQNNAQGAQSSTTGQGAAAGQAKLSSEQQTKITTAFKSDKSLKSVSKSEINVSLSIGTKIPSHVHLYPVPTTVISVHPEWRGYYVILVDGEYVIIEPKTREIVYIIT